VDYGSNDGVAVVTGTVAAAGTITVRDILRSMAELEANVFNNIAFTRPTDTTAYAIGDSFEVGDAAAQDKGIALLKSWLSPEQLEQYDREQSFDVTGGDSGKRYRIRHGRQMNIEELGADGKKVCGWCFLPEGQLVAGDCMLAQKIALETDERAALKVANKINEQPVYVSNPALHHFRRGFIDWPAIA
jgi:hypothetical protein